MENLIFSVNVVLPIFLLMCIGILLRKVKIFNDEFLEKGNNFAFKVLLPTLVFNNIYQSRISEEVNVNLIIFAVVIVLGTIGLMFLIVPRFEKDNRNIGIIIQGIYRSNFVLFGVPLSSNLFGDSNLAVVTTLVAIIIPIYNFMAVIILEWYSNNKSNYKKTVVNILKNPLIIGSVLGITASLLNSRMPVPLEKTVSEVAKTATPFSLMVLGGEIKIGNIKKNLKYIVTVSAAKLIILPAIVLAVAVAFGYRGVELGALFSMVAPSVAVSSYTMAQQYDCNSELAGQLVFMTTLFSPVTIFLFIFIMKSTGLF